MPEDWDRYVAAYHDANPGITEDVLADARDAGGRSPYDWVVEAVPAGASPVVDLACGSGPLAALLGPSRVVGVDRSAGELARAAGSRVRAEATGLPLAGGSAGAVVSSMALMLLHPVEAVLSEVRRVLRPDGTFVATVPSRGATTGGPAFTRILRDLDQVGVGYPEPLDGDLAGRFSASGMTLVGDDTADFTRAVSGSADADRIVRSFYAPGAGEDRVTEAVERFRDSAPAEVVYRLRRLVARCVTMATGTPPPGRRRERPPA